MADAAALKHASVGVVTNLACDVAKDSSDLILLQGEFANIRTALMWGRNLNRNMQRFLQFQLTINLTISFVTILGGIFGHPPLNVIQMLWANLVMDILAAIALGTEKWSDKAPAVQTSQVIAQAQSEGKLDKSSIVQSFKDRDDSLAMRIARKDPMMRPFMWQQILVQAAWQCFVLTILMFFGGLILFKEDRPNLVMTPLRDSETLLGTNRLIMDTFIFHVFILMNLFNSINCRVIALGELNVFRTIHHNITFLIILVLELIFQQWMVNCGSRTLTIQSALLGTGELTTAMNLVAWVLGLFSVVIGVFAKKIPTKYFAFTDNVKWHLEEEMNTREYMWNKTKECWKNHCTKKDDR
jgi:Ca2+-transporting ATPase